MNSTARNSVTRLLKCSSGGALKTEICPEDSRIISYLLLGAFLIAP